MTTRFQTTSPVVSRSLDQDETFAGPDDVCLRIGMIDRAGNESDSVVEACLPCFYRDVGGTVELEEIPVEPAWTDDDVFGGGVCAVVDGSTGDDGGVDESGDEGSADDGSAPADEGGDGDDGDDGGSGDSGGPGSGSNSAGEAVELADRGCGCTSGSHGPGVMALLLVLVGGARTRARRR